MSAIISQKFIDFWKRIASCLKHIIFWDLSGFMLLTSSYHQTLSNADIRNLQESLLVYVYVGPIE
jgi:hypothetical protein